MKVPVLSEKHACLLPFFTESKDIRWLSSVPHELKWNRRQSACNQPKRTLHRHKCARSEQWREAHSEIGSNDKDEEKERKWGKIYEIVDKTSCHLLLIVKSARGRHERSFYRQTESVIRGETDGKNGQRCVTVCVCVWCAAAAMKRVDCRPAACLLHLIINETLKRPPYGAELPSNYGNLFHNHHTTTTTTRTRTRTTPPCALSRGLGWRRKGNDDDGG